MKHVTPLFPPESIFMKRSTRFCVHVRVSSRSQSTSNATDIYKCAYSYVYANKRAFHRKLWLLQLSITFGATTICLKRPRLPRAVFLFRIVHLAGFHTHEAKSTCPLSYSENALIIVYHSTRFRTGLRICMMRPRIAILMRSSDRREKAHRRKHARRLTR